MSKAANLVGCVAQPSTRLRRAWTMAKVSTDVKAVVEKLLCIVTVFRPLHARLLTPSPSSMRFLTAYTIVLDRQGNCDVTHFVFRAKKCRNFHPIVSLRSHFFSSVSQPQSFVRVKQKSDNNCQTNEIVTKSFFLADSLCVLR